ncbi:unnamed protein product (macronuclear) [Paramecium tetraurelia]|uniref:ATPase AAA-type core domain-containing protein n=1 Tax=Paramecium tetraurelia TaxID=5888 RepID=A0DFT2_PARTE|nr:uncharacterized protein GSPATT00016712001 [Paramecium tetraurelia]CAK81899.1 unnamed protein product [Paramecium tetraurelia]|eukprot:XP_001449296.1 hypothetical protein (macronuclear) [Paramecium tetraurelia strain d4-2]
MQYTFECEINKCALTLCQDAQKFLIKSTSISLILQILTKGDENINKRIQQKLLNAFVESCFRRTMKAFIILFDEINAIGGVRHNKGNYNNGQIIMLKDDIKVSMATHRLNTFGSRILKSQEIRQKSVFFPGIEDQSGTFKIQARTMSMENNFGYELLARLI